MAHRPSLLLAVGLLLIAAMLMILPLPHWAHVVRPQWMLLLLMVWTRLYRHYVSLMVVFVIGLLVDMLLGTTLGQHAFAYVAVIALFCHYHRRITCFSLLQQSGVVLLLVVLSGLLQWLLAWCFSANTPQAAMLLSSITTTLLWPWLMVLLHPGHDQRASARL